MLAVIVQTERQRTSVSPRSNFFNIAFTRITNKAACFCFHSFRKDRRGKEYKNFLYLPS